MVSALSQGVALSGTLSSCGVGPVNVESQGQTGDTTAALAGSLMPLWMFGEHSLCFPHIYCIRVSVDKMLWVSEAL